MLTWTQREGVKGRWVPGFVLLPFCRFAQEAAPQWVTTTAVIVILVAAAVVAFIIYERRIRGFERLAEKLGLKFHEHGRGGAGIPNESFLARSGWFAAVGRTRLQLEGMLDGFRVSVFEYYRVSDETKGTTRGYPVSVFTADMRGLPLPAFLLRPEGIRLKLAQAFGGADIDFLEGNSARFSARYALTSDDETGMRSVFGGELRRFLGERPGWIVEVVEDRLLCYRPPKIFRFLRHTPKRVSRLVKDSREILRLLNAACAKKS